MNKKGEFEERNFQHDAEGVTSGMGGSRVAHDKIDAAPFGSPKIDYDVRSTFDVRPINAYDFNLSGNTQIQDDGFGGPNLADISFVVRTGYVMVPKRFHHWTYAPIVNRENLVVSVQVDGGNVLDNVNIPIGAASDDLVELFLTLDEGQTLNFHFTTPGIGGGTFGSQSLYVHLYGTYLFKTGRPAAFEIANEMSGAGSGGQSIESHISNALPSLPKSTALPYMPKLAAPEPMGPPPPIVDTRIPTAFTNNPCIHLPANFYRMSAHEQYRYYVRNKCVGSVARQT